MLDQGWSGEVLEFGKLERKAQHATERSGVECGVERRLPKFAAPGGAGELGVSCGFRGCG
jgi:hypothetical protein